MVVLLATAEQIEEERYSTRDQARFVMETVTITGAREFQPSPDEGLMSETRMQRRRVWWAFRQVRGLVGAWGFETQTTTVSIGESAPRITRKAFLQRKN